MNFFRIICQLDDDELLEYLHDEIQGKGRHNELVEWGNSSNEPNVLQFALQVKKSTKIILKLIEIGGRDLVMSIDDDLCTTLYYACISRYPTAIITKLIEVGGRELVLAKDKNGNNTVLHCASAYGASIESISKLIESGGSELLIEKDGPGYAALHHGYFFHYSSSTFDDRFTLLVREGILARVGGEFGIGGLFHSAPPGDEKGVLQNNIYKKWEDFVPLLETALASLEKQPPILHAAIIAKAPQNIIKDIIQRFDCISSKDSLNRQPIDVAIGESLGWYEGIRDIIVATATSLQRPVLHIAAQYGLKWSNGLQELVELDAEEVVGGQDCLTNLRLFMVCAMGNDSDLSSVYGMMKMSPELK